MQSKRIRENQSEKNEVTIQAKQRRGPSTLVLQPAYKKKLSISVPKIYTDLAKLCKDGVFLSRVSGNVWMN